METLSAMDILRPPIIRIGNRCYRRNPVQTKSELYEDDEEVLEPNSAMCDRAYEDETCDAFMADIQQTDGGYRMSIDIPSVFFKFLIGKKGETKKRIENETRTLIKIPRQGMHGPVVVTGHDQRGMVSCRTRIDLLVASARDKQPFTHFLSIPINSQPIRDKFAEFKDNVVRFCDGDRGIDDTIFQNPHKLHLTLGTMPLLSSDEIDRAKTLLQQCRQEVIENILRGRALLCQVRGLEYMNDDPAHVDVLYAKVDLLEDSDRLQQIVDRLVDRFVTAGLMRRDYDKVKLHITVMNSLMRRDLIPGGATSHDRTSRERESFDARRVLQMYGDYDFGPYTINNIQLSQRHVTGKDGYYDCEVAVSL